MLANALRICEAKFGMLMLHRKSEGSFDARVMVGAPPALIDALLQKPFKPPPGVPLDRMMRTKKAVHTIDAAAEQVKPRSAELAGARTRITVADAQAERADWSPLHLSTGGPSLHR